MHSSYKSRRGITILIMVVALLIISTLLILFAAQYSTLQQKISSSLYQNQQAFEAAQAGLEAAIPYFQDNYAAIVAQQGNGFLTPYQNSSTQNVSLANNSQYTFVYSNPTAYNYQLITITSTGTNMDGTSTRTITEQIQAYNFGIPIPNFTLITQGDVALSGNASLNNTQTNLNIDAGNSISFSGSAQSTISSGVGSNANALGSDVTQNDTTLSAMTNNLFFQNIFNVNTSTAQNAASYTYNYLSDHTYNSNLNGITGAVIWINQSAGTATINSTTTVGSLVQPVILIVNGNLEIANAATIYGLVFILNPSSNIIITDTANITGAIATTGNLSFQNFATLTFNNTVLNALPSVGGAPNYAKVPGSWRDF